MIFKTTDSVPASFFFCDNRHGVAPVKPALPSGYQKVTLSGLGLNQQMGLILEDGRRVRALLTVIFRMVDAELDQPGS